MRKEDRPHESIWLDDKALAAHFERLDEKQASGRDREEVPDLDDNEFTKGLR